MGARRYGLRRLLGRSRPFVLSGPSWNLEQLALLSMLGCGLSQWDVPAIHLVVALMLPLSGAFVNPVCVHNGHAYNTLLQ